MGLSKEKIWILQQFMFEEVFGELESVFNTLEIPFMPVKGMYLIHEGLSQEMGYRRMCDIDIIVYHRDLQRATDYFFKCESVLPRTCCTDNYRPYETQFYYLYKGSNVLIELHSLLNFPSRFSLPVEGLFKRSEKRGGNKYVLSKEEALIVMVCHLYTHFPFQYREEWSTEAGLLSAKDGFDWEYFWGRAKETGICGFFVFIFRFWNRRYNQDFPVLRHNPYSRFQSMVFSFFGYERIPFWYRRFFIDIAFMNRPLEVVAHKVGW